MISPRKTPEENIAALERLLNYGYGKTGKPLSARHIAKIKEEIERQKVLVVNNPQTSER
jgi:hypothetical protein